MAMVLYKNTETTEATWIGYNHDHLAKLYNFHDRLKFLDQAKKEVKPAKVIQVYRGHGNYISLI